MPNNLELLNKIYKSSKTSLDAIDIVLTRVNSRELERALDVQKEKYFKIAEEASEELKGYNRLPEEQGFLEKMDFTITFRTETMRNPSSNHMAEVLIDGCTGGINEMLGELHSYKNFTINCINLAKILIETEEETIENLQKFL